MKFVPALLAAQVLVACAPVVVPIADGPPGGPQLAIQVANASDRDVEVGYEFEDINTGGGGAGTVASCEQALMTFGFVSGRYRVLLDGVRVHEAAAPGGVPADAWVVVRVSISADGNAEVVGIGIAATMPDPDPRPIADCS